MTRNLLLLFAATLLGAIAARPATAAQFNVTTAANSGPGSLRQALLDAAAAPGDDDVVLTPTVGTITVSSEEGRYTRFQIELPIVAQAEPKYV